MFNYLPKSSPELSRKPAQSASAKVSPAPAQAARVQITQLAVPQGFVPAYIVVRFNVML